MGLRLIGEVMLRIAAALLARLACGMARRAIGHIAVERIVKKAYIDQHFINQ
jgi:hypothetical protein